MEVAEVAGMRSGAGVDNFLVTFLTLTVIRCSRFGAGMFFFTISKTSGVHAVGCHHKQRVVENRFVGIGRGE